MGSIAGVLGRRRGGRRGARVRRPGVAAVGAGSPPHDGRRHGEDPIRQRARFAQGRRAAVLVRAVRRADGRREPLHAAAEARRMVGRQRSLRDHLGRADGPERRGAFARRHGAESQDAAERGLPHASTCLRRRSTTERGPSWCGCTAAASRPAPATTCCTTARISRRRKTSSSSRSITGSTSSATCISRTSAARSGPARRTSACRTWSPRCNGSRTTSRASAATPIA